MVSSVVNFGAFVDLGGMDGLVHVSELSWKHIDHPSEVVEVGDEVEVEVLDVDLDRERVSLSLKATQEDPWQAFAREHEVGQIVDGEVTKLVPFGAFVKVADGIEGLVHISELAERHVEVPEAVVNVGDKVDVKVIDIDTVRRRISLSLKQAQVADEPTEQDPYETAPAVETAYSSGDDAAPVTSGSMAAAFAQAGFGADAADLSPEEMALAEADLPPEEREDAPEQRAAAAEAAAETSAEAEAPAESEPAEPETPAEPAEAESEASESDDEGTA